MVNQPRRRDSFAERRERKAAVDDPAIVLEAAARFLEARSRSVAEVRRRLTGAGYRADLVEGAIARMLELGMLDDGAFARAWVESRDRARPRGERALWRELRLKGVADDVIAGVMAERGPAAGAEWPDPGAADEIAAGRLLARKAAALARIPDASQRRRRAYALLVRAGFDSSVASRLARAQAEDVTEDAE